MLTIRYDMLSEGRYPSYKGGTATSTDSMTYTAESAVPCHPHKKFIRRRDLSFRWVGDYIRTYPGIPHGKNDCHHRKLDGRIRIRRPTHALWPDSYRGITYDSSKFSDPQEALKLPPKVNSVHPYDKRPLWVATHTGDWDFIFPPLYEKSWTTVVTLDRDRYSSAASWRYYVIVRFATSYPCFVDGYGCFINVSGSYRSRWEVDMPENWTCDISFSFVYPQDTRVPGGSYHYDFINRVWVDRIPYNRWYNRPATRDEAEGAIRGNFPIPSPPPSLHKIFTYREPEGQRTILVEESPYWNSSIPDFQSYFSTKVNELAIAVSQVPINRSTHHKDLHLKMVQSINRFDSGLLLYLKDLPSVGGSVETVVKALSERSLNSPASVWLTQRFSDRLTFADTKELVESLRTALEKGLILRGRFRRAERDTLSTSCEIPNLGTVRYTETWNSSAWFQPKNDDSIMETLSRVVSEWDIISLGNLWDSIPYSFVVNWFIDVQGVLDIVDAKLEASHFNISDVWDSVKRTYDLKTALANSTSTEVEVEFLRYSVYDRNNPDTLALPVFTHPLEPIGEGLHNWKHITDMGALVIQRIT